MATHVSEDSNPPDIAGALRAHNLRATPQRQAILATFEGGAAEHLSAEEIHARATARVKGLGRGTVYATLADLSEVGLLGAVGDQEPIRYEVNTDAHQHFRCRICLRVIDVDIDPPPAAALTKSGFTVESVSVVAEGVCRDCREYERGLHDGSAAMRDHTQIADDRAGGLSCMRHESSVGPVLAAASGDGIARIAFPGQADFDALDERVRRRRGGHAGRDRAGHLLDAVDAYLDGDREPLADVIDWSLLDPGSRVALEAVQRVAWGERRSYLDICPMDAYDCGYLMGTNPVPLLVPCHRISRGHEVMVDYVGGAELRDRLDRLEH